MTRNQAIEIARQRALNTRESHGYLPVTEADAQTWMPHEWVIDAILWATMQRDLAAQQPCQYCNDTGDVHGLDGEWQGTCTACKWGAARPAAQPVALTVDEKAALDRALLRSVKIVDEAAQPVAWYSVIAERQRQIESEGWTARHDDDHSDGSMALAAACYALNAATWAAKGTAELRQSYADLSPGARWPWKRKWWKPKSQRQDLVRAGALILAEIERLDRANPAYAAQPQQAAQPVAQEPRVCWLVEEFSDSGNSTGRYMLDQNGLTITTDAQQARRFLGSRTATFRATDMREKWGTSWRPVSHVFRAAQPQQAEGDTP